MTAASTFCAYFGIRPDDGRVLAALYDCAGTPILRHDLKDFAGPGRDLNDSLAELRLAMDRGALLSLPGCEVVLTKAGKAECDLALAEAAQQERVA